jgi:hypothetical protein
MKGKLKGIWRILTNKHWLLFNIDKKHSEIASVGWVSHELLVNAYDIIGDELDVRDGVETVNKILNHNE